MKTSQQDYWPQQKIIITAAGSGIGSDVVAAFLERGASVYFCDVVPERVTEMLDRHPRLLGKVVDVADPNAVDGFIDSGVKALGGLTILINNAGIAGPAGPVESISTEDWNRTFAINVAGQFYCVRRAVPTLKANGGGSIVNMASVAGKFGFPLRSPYSTSKWAVVGFSRGLSIELGPHKIRVNSILPGVVDGERIKDVFTARAASKGISYDEMERQALASASLGTMVSHEEIAEMILYITSPVGRSITGQSLSICGGMEWLI
jgi:NAD(P)-dependent dehydrogenase (short-subunit alcohol dehydrogenase family)